MKTLPTFSLLCFLLLSGFSACKKRASLPNESKSIEVQRIVMAGVAEAKDVRFDDRYELVGAATRLTLDGVVLETAWKSLKKQRRECLVAVHLTDKEGKILAQADYRQSEGEVTEGVFWREETIIPCEKFDGASAIGIGLLESGDKWLFADRGPRDLENRRLLLPIPAQLPEPGKRVPYAGFLEAADCKEIVGWVWNKAQPDGVVKVDICDDDRVLQTVEALELRDDLVKNAVGTGKYGFRVPTPAQLKDGQPHTVRVRVATTPIELRKSGRSLTCK